MFVKSKSIAFLLLVYLKYTKCFVHFDPHLYCLKEAELCERGRQHIYCHPEQLVPEGKLVRVYKPSDKFKQQILEIHNNYRDAVACGDNVTDPDKKFYYPAARMIEMVWDNELMFLATQHAKRCNLYHDECRNSIRYSDVGQNIYAEEYHINAFHRPPRVVIPDAIAMWYNERKILVRKELSEPFRTSGNFQSAGHFETLVLENATRVGCAMAQCTNKTKVLQYFTCDYSETIRIGELIYKIGTPQSECKKSSKQYRCLCATAKESNESLFGIESHMSKTMTDIINIRDLKNKASDVYGCINIKFLTYNYLILVVIMLI